MTWLSRKNSWKFRCLMFWGNWRWTYLLKFCFYLLVVAEFLINGSDRTVVLSHHWFIIGSFFSTKYNACCVANAKKHLRDIYLLDANLYYTSNEWNLCGKRKIILLLAAQLRNLHSIEHCKTGACKITCDGCRYPVPQVNLPAEAGKNLRRYQLPAVSAGNW